MVNLYDSPAQAKFINTYVPIQFEQLYKMADKAEKDLDESNEFMEKLITDSNLNTPSRIDAANWDKKVKTPIMQLAERAASDPDLMKSKAFQAEVKGLTRRIKSDQSVFNMVNNATAMKQYIAKSDPRWGGLENDNAFNYDSSKNGAFFMQNVDYQSGGEIFKENVDKIDPKVGFSKDGKWIQKEITMEDVSNAIDKGIPEALSNPALQMHWKRAKANGTAKQYMEVDKNGNITENISKFAKDLGMSAASDIVGIKDIDMNPEYQMQQEYNMKMRYAQAQRDIEAKTKSDAISSVVIGALKTGNETAANNKVELFGSKIDTALKSMTEGKKGIWTVNMGRSNASDIKASGIMPELASMKLLEAKLSRLDPKSKEYAAYKITYDKNKLAAMTKMSDFMDAASDKGSGSFGIDSREVGRMNMYTVSSPALDGLKKAHFGDKGYAVEFSDRQAEVFNTTGTKGFKVVDPASGNKLQNDFTDIIESKLKSGSLDGKIVFEPTNTQRRTGPGTADMIGFMYVPNDILTADEKTKYKKHIDESGVSEVNTIESEGSQPRVYYRIPVSTNSMRFDNSNPNALNRATVDYVASEAGYSSYKETDY